MVELEEPDKGRAWVIAISASLINLILAGLSRMVGILYVALIDTYGVTREEATVPFTVRNSVRCLSGPLVGILGQRFGIRVVTFWGGILATAGAALCSIAPNVTWLAIIWGGLHGLGFALANTLYQVVLNQYFQKYRATASGIALSGECIGSMIFPFVLDAVLDEYALYSTFLIMGGIVMHVLPPSLLLTAPQWVEYPEAYARLYALKKPGLASEKVSTTDVMIDKNGESICEQGVEDDKKMVITTSLNNYPEESVDTCKCSTTENHQWERDTGPFVVIDWSSKRLEGTSYQRLKSPKTSKRCSAKNGSDSPAVPCSYQNDYHITGNVPADTKSPLEEKMKAQRPPAPPSQRPAETETLLQSMKAFAALYLNPMYILISICLTTYVLISIPILTVVVDYSKDKGIPETYGKYLIDAMAIGDLAGRLCFGWVTDRKVLTLPHFLLSILVLQGLFIGLLPFALSFTSVMAVLVLYSMMAGSLLVIFPVLVLEYVDSRSQSVGMACVGFLAGIISFGSPPAIGYFRDYVGSYDGMFYITGGISIACGVLWLLEPIIVKYFHIIKNSDTNEDTCFLIQEDKEEIPMRS